MINLTVLENGNLRLEFDGDSYDREDIEESLENNGTVGAFCDMLESNTCNGWDLRFGDNIGQMTSAPFLFEDSVISDDGMTLQNFGRVWWHPDYMVKDEVETILANGFMDFTLCPDFVKGDEFPLT